jgi:Gpi18-like mannosyltransferase
VSLAGTAFLAVAFADLLKAVGAPARRALALLVLPTVVLNGPLLGQCDALWSGACIFAIAMMIRDRTAASLAWCGVAIAFKAQSVFIAPFILGAVVKRRAPLWQWAIPGLVYAAMMIPAWLAGWPAADLFTVYLRQAGEYDFSGRLATPWVWVGVTIHDAASNFYFIGYSAAVAAAAGIAYLSYRAKREAMLPVALLSAIAVPFILPRMHERYFFLADVLSLALALSLRSRMAITAAVGIQFASLASLLSYFFLVFYVRPFPTLVGSLFAAAALIATWRIIRDDEHASRVPAPA